MKAANKLSIISSAMQGVNWRTLVQDYWIKDSAVASTPLASANGILPNISVNTVDTVDADGFTLTGDASFTIDQAQGGVFGIVKCVGLSPGAGTSGASKAGAGGWKVGFAWDWVTPPNYLFGATSSVPNLSVPAKNVGRALATGDIGVYVSGKENSAASIIFLPDTAGAEEYSFNSFNTNSGQGNLVPQTITIGSLASRNLRWVAIGLISGLPTRAMADSMYSEYGP